MDVGAGQLRGDDFDEVVSQLLGELSRDVGLATAGWTVEQDTVRDGETVPPIGLRVPDRGDDLTAQKLLESVHASDLVEALSYYG